MSMAMKYRMQKRMASGGTVTGCRQTEAHDEDMVGKIMRKRMSEGGMVANDTPPTADFEDADYDDLAERDDLEEHYTGANSGDEDGGLADDDMIDRIMLKRKKDRMPRPA